MERERETDRETEKERRGNIEGLKSKREKK